VNGITAKSSVITIERGGRGNDKVKGLYRRKGAKMGMRFKEKREPFQKGEKKEPRSGRIVPEVGQTNQQLTCREEKRAVERRARN